MNNLTTNITSFLLDYSKCESEDDFLNLFDSLSKLNFEDFFRFVKRSQCYQYGSSFKVRELKSSNNNRKVQVTHTEYFWNSMLVLRWAENLFTSDYSEEIMFGFFSNSKNYNERLLKEIALYNPYQFIRSVKLKKCFLEDELFSKLSFMKTSSNSSIRNFYSEISALKKLNENWLEKKKFYQSVIEQFSLEEILIHSVAYYEKFKRSSKSIEDNRGHQISIEVCLISVLNFILAERNKNGTEIKNELSIEEFYSVVNNTMPPLNTPEGIANKKYLVDEIISPTKRIIRESLEFYFSYLHGFMYQVDKYCVGYADVTEISENRVQLITNRDYQYFKRDDKKNGFVEKYFSNLANQSEELKLKNRNEMDFNKRQENLTNVTYQKHFSFMKAETIRHKGIEIKQEDLIQLLWNFSQWIMPQGRTIILSKEEETEDATWMRPLISKRQVPKDFNKLFPTGYIVAFKDTDLSESCAKFFGWEIEKCKLLLDYITYNLNASGNCKFPEFPLIKIKNHYFWLSTFLRDRNWFNILLGRIQIKIHNEQSTQLERSMADLFEGAGFSSISSVIYKDEEIGEIDCVAYKDGCLFIIEMKTTYLSEDLLRQSEFDSRKLEHKAVQQLDRVCDFYVNNFEEFKRCTQLQIDLPQSEIKVYTLIVSNTFERDKTLKGFRHLKLSLFELMIILKNDLCKMLNSNLSSLFPDDKAFGEMDIPFYMLNKIFNKNNPFLANEVIDTSKTACDLYEGKPISAGKFVEIIEQDRVWSFLERAYRFDLVEPISLQVFNPDFKWLV